MQIQPQEILDRGDELWAIHTYGCDLEAEVQHGCLALIVDPRYVKYCGFESRLAVSFGRNPFSPEMVSGFVPPPYKPGEYLFGLHNVGVLENQLSLYDMLLKPGWLSRTWHFASNWRFAYNRSNVRNCVHVTGSSGCACRDSGPTGNRLCA
jgi:hypothetical protein